MTNKTYIRNTAVLFAAMAVTKIVGAVFKIPLANILGGTGMGYFSAAYGLYSPVFAITAAGIPTVLMRITAQNMAAGRCKNAEKTKKTALVLFTLIGAVGMCVIWLLSSLFAERIVGSPQSRAAIVLIAPAVLFCCTASVYRGYHEGCFNVVPTALANVTEAVSRAVIGLAVSYGVLLYAKSCFANGRAFMGVHYSSYSQAYEAALPMAAAGAVFAVTLSEACGLAALLFQDKKCCKRTVQRPLNASVESTRSIVARLVRDILPIALFALVMNCFSFIDLLTVTRTIDASIIEATDYYSRVFRDVFASGISYEEFANFAYGSYTGIAMSLFMLIPSFAGMTEKTSIPEITSAWEKRDAKLLNDKVSMLFKTSALIGFPACFGAAAMASPILSMLYSNRSAEISVCINSFTILCIGGMFMVIASALSGLFQALGRADIPLWLMAGAVLVKALLNPLLISIPMVNISGAAAATVISYMLVCVVGIIIMKRFSLRRHCFRSLVPIAVSAVGCALTARVLYEMLSECIIQPFVTLFSVFLGGIVYVILLILTGVFRTSPIIKSEKKKI